MVQGKKVNDMSNGASKFHQPNMAFQRKDMSDSRSGGVARVDNRAQNGNTSFRTDSAISGAKNQGDRTLQRWIPDTPEDTDGALESSRKPPAGAAQWDQFAENERRFGLKTDYNENIYTTTIDKSHPQYKQRVAEAERKAREIERSTATNSHVAEERIIDNVAGNDNGLDEEDKYSGVRRQDFPPLASSNSNKYTPPARRAPTGQSTVSGAPVDPAIISSQLARPDKVIPEKKAVIPVQKAPKPEIATPLTTTESSVIATPEAKTTVAKPSSSANRTTPPQVRTEGAPNATATVERDVASAFKNFASQQRRNVEHARISKAKNDKEIKLNDLKRFADSFKLNTPVPSDLVPIIAKDPAKQKEIQEKAKRNAEEAKANPSEAVKPIVPPSEVKAAAQRPTPSAHGTSPSNVPSRQNLNRAPNFPHQNPYNNSQSFRGDRSTQGQQPMAAQQGRTPGNLGLRLRNIEQSKNVTNPTAEARLPPTGPANSADPNYSRRSSGVTSAQGGRLNPSSNEFRPSPHAASFNPTANPSSGSSPHSALNAAESPAPAPRTLLKRKPIAKADRPSLKEKFSAMEYIMAIKPAPEKNWSSTGGFKPAYDTPPTWRQAANEETAGSTMTMTYTKLFEMTPFPSQTMSPPNPSHAIPQVPHQHQLPFHLQQSVHNMNQRQSPRQPPMNIPGNQHGHGPASQFNGPDDHRMMPSHSAQSFASPRLPNVPMAFPSPMNQNAQIAYNNPMMPYPGAPPMQPYRSLSQSHQFMPQQQHMGPAIMMQNPANGFMTSQGMAPGPQIMYPQNGQGHFMPQGNGHPPAMPGVNGYPSPGRSAPMMMSQGSQQGHQQPPMFMTPGMSPGPQYGNVAPIYAQQPPGQMQMRGYNGPAPFGTSPQQMHHFSPQQRNNHQNGNYNNNKNFQPHGQHSSGPQNNQALNGPQARASEGAEEAK